MKKIVMKRITLILLLYLLIIPSVFADNNSLNFGGRVLVEDSDDWAFGMGDFTIETWMNSSAYGLWHPFIILHQGNTGGPATRWDLNGGIWGPAPEPAFMNFSASDGPTTAYVGAILHNMENLNTWYHYALVRDGLNWHSYCNGIEQYTEIIFNGEIGNFDGALSIGSTYPADVWPFSGLLDEMRVWKVARTQEEIQTWMNSELYGNESGLVAYWNFNEGNGNTLYDMSGNGHDGQLSGPTWAPGAPVSPVPEPATMVLFGLGGLATAFIKRRRKV